MPTSLTASIVLTPAGDISESTSLSVTTFNLSESSDRTVTQSVSHTAHAALTTTGVTSPGYVVVKNMDSTNYVEVGVEVSSTFYPLARVRPGRFAAFELAPGVTIFAKSNTAAAVLRYRVFSA